MTRTGWIGLCLGLGLGPGLGCGSSSVFQCQSDAECGADGTCQAVGYCSFPDDECSGDQRYGEHAGEGLAGTCVDAGGSSSVGSGETLDSETLDGADSTTGSEGSCGGDAECVPLPPAGWEGPVLAVLGTGEAPPCPAGLPEPLYVAQAGLSVDAAQCACECGIGSSPCDTTAYASLNGACSEDLPFDVPSGECVSLDISLAPKGTSVVVPATGGFCEATLSQDVAPPQWTDEVRVCTGALAGCGEGACVPTAMVGEGVCIVREGEHTCPLSGYTQSFTFHRGVDDSRGCSQCECDGGASCWLEVYTEETCSGAPLLGLSLDQDLCVPVDDVVPEGQTEPMGALIQQQGGCSPQGGEPTGTAVPAEPITLCCLP